VPNQDEAERFRSAFSVARPSGEATGRVIEAIPSHQPAWPAYPMMTAVAY
jgi:hypothetical protein